MAVQNRFAFVDGLSGLFLQIQQNSSPAKPGVKILGKSDLTSIHKEIQHAMEGLVGGQDPGGKVLLVIDQIDLLIAAGGEDFTSNRVAQMLLDLREVCDPIHVIR
jgi:elongator complex protein 6